MANTLLTPTAITREALRILHNKLTFVGNINRQYDDRFQIGGIKTGGALQIRLPNKFTTTTGASLSTQDVTETKVDLAVGTQRHVDFTFSSAELTLTIQEFSQRYLEPAMATLAATIEADAFNMYKEVYNLVGTAGTTPASLKVFLQARQKLNENLTPKDNLRRIVINSETAVEVVDALKGLFHAGSEIERQYREGMMGRTAGFDWYENELVPTHTNGTMGGTPLIKGANQDGDEIDTDGWTGSHTITEGTVFTIANVYAVHPETKSTTSRLQQFVVTEDVTADGSGNATLKISPSIITSGAYQTVSGSPADNAAITVVGAASGQYPQNLAFHRDAFVFATADLEMPNDVHFKAREVYDGISMRVLRQYTINDDQIPCRIDVYYGYKCVRPEMACRITA